MQTKTVRVVSDTTPIVSGLAEMRNTAKPITGVIEVMSGHKRILTAAPEIFPRIHRTNQISANKMLQILSTKVQTIKPNKPKIRSGETRFKLDAM